MIGYLGSKKFLFNKICKDDNRRGLIIEVEIETKRSIWLNLYNPYSETEHLQALSDVDLLLSDFSLDNKKAFVFAGDFNFFFNQKIEATGGNPVLKKSQFQKFYKLLKKYDLIDLFTRFTFRKNHFSGFIQRRLDYILIFNSIQESV